MKIICVFIVAFLAFCPFIASQQQEPLSVHRQLMKLIETKSAKDQFKLWHHLFEKPYDLNSNEALNRYKIFKQNLKVINDHNAKNLGFSYGLGPFTDLTNEEFRSFSSGLSQIVTPTQIEEMNAQQSGKINFDTLADLDDAASNQNEDNDDFESKDWSYLYTEDAGDQAKPVYCASCWAFAASEAVAGLLTKQTGIYKRLSVQQLVDCSKAGTCGGGYLDKPYDYIKSHGLSTSDSYPYTAKDETCKEVKPYVKVSAYEGCIPQLDTKTWERVLPNCTPLLKKGLIQGPVSVGIDESQHYSDGLIEGKDSFFINHAVVAVQMTINFIKIRNSYGRKWGNNGYARYARTYSKYNFKSCGIEHAVVVAASVIKVDN